jgi:hypothetical protein
MYRDRLAQYHQAAGVNVIHAETADSVARALDYQRQERARILDAVFRCGDLESFDRHFRDFYREDKAIVLLLTDAAARRGLEVVDAGPMQ